MQHLSPIVLYTDTQFIVTASAKSKKVAVEHSDSDDQEHVVESSASKKVLKGTASTSGDISVSTSTTPVPDVTTAKSSAKSAASKVKLKKPTKVAKVVKPKPVGITKPKDWNTLSTEWFRAVALEEAEEDEDGHVVPIAAPGSLAPAKEKMEGGAIVKLFEEMDLSMEGVSLQFYTSVSSAC